MLEVGHEMRAGKTLGVPATRIGIPLERSNTFESVSKRIDRVIGDENPRHTVVHRLAGAAAPKSDDRGSAGLRLYGDHPEIFSPRQ